MAPDNLVRGDSCDSSHRENLGGENAMWTLATLMVKWWWECLKWEWKRDRLRRGVWVDRLRRKVKVARAASRKYSG